MSLQELQNRIQQNVGIQVSAEWLQACASYLEQQPSNGSLLDRCLHQLLYTDIRDLVLENASPVVTSLQALVARSKSSPAPIANGEPPLATRIQTPTDFRLLVQLEEAVDFSLSREHRFNPQHFQNRTENNNNRNRNNNMPRQRCLKLCLSSGHANSTALLGQEVTMIPNLKPDSPAGTKILLQGSIVIKHGYLQLHSGNATVLGGHVTALVQIQQAAMEKARKEMGVGVDPTVRALVGVDDLTPEEPSDEGNEESGDVVEPTATTPANSAQHTTSFTAPSATATNSLSTTNGRSSSGTFRNNGSTTTNNSNHFRNHQASAPPAPTPAPAPIIHAPNNPYRNVGPFGGTRTSNPQQQQQQPPPQSSNETMNQNPYARRQGPSSSTPRVSISPRPSNAPNINPYATKNNNSNTNRQVLTTTNSSSSNMASATSPFPTTATEDITTRTTTPVSNSSTTITPASTASNAARRNPYLKSNNNNANQGPASMPGFRTASSMLPGNPRPVSCSTLPVSSAPPSTDGANNKNTTLTNPSNVQNMTFANLYKLLETAIQNRQLYETYSSVTFRVAMLQKTNKHVFNVGKNKDFQKKKQAGPSNSKYVYIMNTTFGTTTTNDQRLLACKLPSSLIEPYFEISATELRGLSKSDRAACDRISKEGGDKVRAKFFPKYLQYWKARLYPKADEVFANQNFALDNCQTPILILEPDKT